jgi:dTDP-4-amino-4,6-dideoxygalactose transaminase
MQDELREANRWPLFDDEERAALDEAMQGNVYAPIAAFEREFAAYHQARFALAHNNGTSAIQAAYFAVGIQPGDEVLCPAYTWHLSVSQLLTLHALPVFCDVDPQTLCISPEDIERKISPHTKAINVLHTFGAVAPMDEILAIARRHGLLVIEDCSHAHGALYKGRKVGTIGDIGCFSLQHSKLMTAIEGGILITDNEEYYERAVLLGHYERVPELKSERYRKYHPDYPQAPTSFGYKYRMHPLGAAIARVQLKKLDDWNAARRRNLTYLTKAMQEIGGGLEPPAEAPDTRRAWINFICQYFPDRMGGVTRERFAEALHAEGLPVTYGRTGYAPVYWNPLYRERAMWAEGVPFDSPYVKRRVEYRKGDCPEAEALWQRTVALPSFPNACSPALLEECVTAIAKVTACHEQLRS